MLIAGGMTSAITNPLKPELKKAVMAADMLMGNDADCLRWLKYQRQLAKEAKAAPAPAAPAPAPTASETPASDASAPGAGAPGAGAPGAGDREARRAARRAERDS